MTAARVIDVSEEESRAEVSEPEGLGDQGSDIAKQMDRTHTIAHAFDQADSYHQRARVQRLIARSLDDRLAKWRAPSRPKVLEVGCGSGFLSEVMVKRYPEGRFLFTDIAPAMVARCRQHLESGNRSASHRFAVMDGSNPALEERFDLIAGSMAFQWFADLKQSLSRLTAHLEPGGCLAFATLGSGTFQEWHGACERAGLPKGTPIYPSAAQWPEIWPGGGVGEMEEEWFTVRHPSGAEFLRDLKRIGAQTPAPDYRPLSPGALRSLLRDLEGADGFSVSYHVIHGIFKKS
ncbi:MAG: methyltransferase [Magnetococcales bacterium]|nr:methyltransferase [Magnetococcales bacterium]